MTTTVRNRLTVLALVLALILVAIVQAPTSHAASVRTAHSAIPYTCSAAYWKTEWSSATSGTVNYNIHITTTMEAWTAQTGEYCNYIRTKVWVTRGTSDCNNVINETLWDKYTTDLDSDKYVTWANCGGSGYALYGDQVYSPSYACPFTAYGSVTETPSPYYAYSEQTAPHCTL